MSKRRRLSMFFRFVCAGALSAACFGWAAAQTEVGRSPATAGGLPGNSFVCLHFDTVTSLSLTGGPFPIPLASDPSNNLGDSVDGYGFVDSTVQVTLSSQRPSSPGPPSVGSATAFLGGDATRSTIEALRGAVGQCPDEIDPVELDGETFFVDSFFDVFFDITVTDVDSRPGRDYVGQPDGASFVIEDQGPAGMSSFYSVLFDADAPTFGLVPPPEADPYIGHFDIEILLGVDINGNGENDKIKFQLATHSAGDENRTFITLPDGTVLEEFDSAAFLEGAVVDESTDPPFTIGGQLPNGLPDPNAFGGPTTASSNLNTPVAQSAVPSVAFGGLALLVAAMLAAMGWWLLRRQRTA